MTKEKAEKKPFYKKIWFWAIVVLVVVVLGVGGTNKEPTKVGENGQIPSDSSENGDFKVGDTISYDGKEITVTKVTRNWTDKYSKPDKNKEYVKVVVKIENKTESSFSYNVLDWKMEDSDGDIKGDTFVYDDSDALHSGELAAGGKKTGSMVFEVPKGDKGLVLHYETSFWSDKDIKIKL